MELARVALPSFPSVLQNLFLAVEFCLRISNQHSQDLSLIVILNLKNVDISFMDKRDPKP